MTAAEDRLTLDRYVFELEQLAPPVLPHGITIRPDCTNRSIIVGNRDFSFVFTWEALRNKVHLHNFASRLARLIEAIEDTLVASSLLRAIGS